jgi:hypothetical protein
MTAQVAASAVAACRMRAATRGGLISLGCAGAFWPAAKGDIGPNVYRPGSAGNVLVRLPPSREKAV